MESNEDHLGGPREGITTGQYCTVSALMPVMTMNEIASLFIELKCEVKLFSREEEGTALLISHEDLKGIDISFSGYAADGSNITDMDSPWDYMVGSAIYDSSNYFREGDVMAALLTCNNFNSGSNHKLIFEPDDELIILEILIDVSGITENLFMDNIYNFFSQARNVPDYLRDNG